MCRWSLCVYRGCSPRRLLVCGGNPDRLRNLLIGGLMPRGKPITENPIDDLKRFYEKTGGNFGYAEYRSGGGKYSANVFNNRFGSWNNALKLAGIEPLLNGIRNYLQKTSFPIEEFTDFPRINASLIDAWFDPHIPYHDVAFCNEALESAYKRKVKTLVIGGDFIDFKGLYKKEVQHIKIDWTEEMGEACIFLDKISKIFDKVYIFMGNHDWRLIRLLENNERAERLYALIFKNPKVKFSKFFFALLNDWLYIVHPDN